MTRLGSRRSDSVAVKPFRETVTKGKQPVTPGSENVILPFTLFPHIFTFTHVLIVVQQHLVPQTSHKR